MATAKKPSKASSTSSNADTASGEWTPEEREAMKEAAKDKRRARKGKTTPAEDLAEVLSKIAAMDDEDRKVAERVHELVTKAAPELAPRTWYGMPAYAKDGKVVCFFQDAGKFKARYSTLGFQDSANLDDGAMWATSFALIKVTPDVAKQITALVKQAVA
jgi:uncharacterized protein YdhG (YjbR/CyaY superfamily)